jgi:hypothetical protein
MRIGFNAPTDPYVLNDSFYRNSTSGAFPNLSTSGLALRSLSISPALKTLILITAGQSLVCNNFGMTVYIPTNSSVVDNFNIYDGAAYEFGPTSALGCSGSGRGNSAPRIGDLLISNGKFDRVITVPIGIGSTPVSEWAAGSCSDRVRVAMRRLAARGIKPGTTGITFAMVWGQGEQDNLDATSQANYTSRLNAFIGPSGRQIDNVHPNDAGASIGATAFTMRWSRVDHPSRAAAGCIFHVPQCSN